MKNYNVMILLCSIYQTNLVYLTRFKITIETSLGMLRAFPKRFN